VRHPKKNQKIIASINDKKSSKGSFFTLFLRELSLMRLKKQIAPIDFLLRAYPKQ
jgi:hypothetical protein